MNRPKALNALNEEMIDIMTPLLQVRLGKGRTAELLCVPLISGRVEGCSILTFS